ncbi:MAG: uroporphyrinogen-III synthase [Candidatus Dadabacteria bacterium]
MVRSKVLSTKELKASLVEQVKEKGIELVQKDFISIKPLSGLDEKIKLLLEEETLVFTSANAVNYIGKFLTNSQHRKKAYQVFCLGGKTKQAVLQNGFDEVQIKAEGENASALAEKIIDSGVKEVVFFCGSKRREELPSVLANAGIKVDELAVYETIERPFKYDEDFDGVLFFSPSAVSSFFSNNHLKETSVCFTVGETTADAVKQHTSNKIIISKEPSQEEIINEVITYFQNINQYND